MTDTEAATTQSTPVSETPAGVDTYSKDYVDELKSKVEKMTRNEALLKAKFAAHEQTQRAMLTEMQPQFEEWVKEGLEHGSMEDKHVMAPMKDFASNLANAENLDSVMPLARMVSVHSARFKRTAEEFSQSAGATEQLARVNKELDEVKAERDAKSSRVDELQEHIKGQDATIVNMTAELAKHGHIKTQFDFSNSSSRETNGANSSTAAMPVAAAAEKTPVIDPLLSFVQKNGGGGSRIGLSATQHHVLGAGGGGDNSLAAALRVAV